MTILLAFTGFLQISPVRRQICALALRELHDRYAIEGNINDLSIEPWRLAATLSGVTLAIANHAPFVTVDRIHCRLHWAAMFRHLSLESLQINRLSIHLMRDDNGRLNLPAMPSGGSSAVSIGRLSVRDGSIDYKDSVAGFSVEVRNANLDLATSSAQSALQGQLRIAEPIRVVRGDLISQFVLAPVHIGYGAEEASFQGFDLDGAEGHIRASGKVESLSAHPILAVRFAGDADLDHVLRWMRQSHERGDGAIAFSGRLSGPVSHPELKLEPSGSALHYGHFTAEKFQIKCAINSEKVTVEALAVNTAGGQLTGHGKFMLQQSQQAGDVDLQWAGLDMATLAGLAGIRIESDLFLAGSLRASWHDSKLSTLELGIENRTLSGTRTHGRLNGLTALVAHAGQWKMVIDQSLGASVKVNATASGRLHDSGIKDCTISGNVKVLAEDAQASSQLLQHLFGTTGRIGSSRAAARANIVLEGTFGDPRAKGIIDGSFQYRTLPRYQIRMQFEADKRVIALQNISAIGERSSFQADGRCDLMRRIVEGNFEVDAMNIEEYRELLPSILQASGSAVISGAIRGRVDRPAINASIIGKDLTCAGQEFADLSASVRYESGVLFVDDADLNQPGGSLHIRGSVSPALKTFLMRAIAQNISLHQSPTLPVQGNCDFDIEGNGTFAHPTSVGWISASSVHWADHHIGDVRANFCLRDNAMTLDATAPELSLVTKTNIIIDPPFSYTATASIEQAQLGRWISNQEDPLFPIRVPVEGIVTMNVMSEGGLSKISDSSVRLSLEKLDGRIEDSSLRLARPAIISYSPADIIIDQIDVQMGGSTLHVAGALRGHNAGQIGASIDGDLADLVPVARVILSLTNEDTAVYRPLDLSGRFFAKLSAIGTRDHMRLSSAIDVSDGCFTPGVFPAATNINMHADCDQDGLDLQMLSGEWVGTPFLCSGFLPASAIADAVPDRYRSIIASRGGSSDRAFLTGRLDGVTLGSVASFLSSGVGSSLNLKTDVSFNFEADSLKVSALRGDIRCDSLEGKAAGISFTQQVPTNLHIENGFLKIDELDWSDRSRKKNKLTARGGFQLTGDHALDLSLNADVDLRLLGVFTPDFPAAGRALLDANIAGALSHPQMDGRVVLQNAEMSFPGMGLAFSELNGNIRLSSDRFETSGIQGIANGGMVTLAGGLRFSEWHVAESSLVFSGRNIEMDFPRGLRSEVNADLALTANRGATSLSGSILVLQGAYRDPLILTASLLSAFQKSNTPRPHKQQLSPALPPLRYNITIKSANNVIIDNNYGRLSLGGALRLTGTTAEPGMVGQLAVQPGGLISFAGNSFRIERGSLDFSNPTQMEPQLRVIAKTRVSGYDITIVMKHDTGGFETRLFSSPPLPPSDIESLLVSGRTVREAESSTAPRSEQIAQALSSDLLSTLGRAIGFDSVRVERAGTYSDISFDPILVAGDTDPGSRLTFTKSFDRFRLIYSQNLKNSGQYTWIVQYNPIHNMELRAVKQDDNSRSYELSHDLSFGGGRTPEKKANAPIRKPLQPRVWLVVFTGENAQKGCDLLHIIKMKTGNRFNFERLQKDRERLLKYFHRLGYLEARVTTRQSAQNSDTKVSLEFVIYRGPKTILLSDGFALTSSLRKLLEVSWTQSVYDGYLIEEMQEIIQWHMVQDHYLKAGIQVQLENDDEKNEKRITLHIVPGSRTPKYRYDFHGDIIFKDDDLRNFLQKKTSFAAAWIGPSTVVEMLLDNYHESGRLAATVIASDPVFTGDTVALPFMINSGPLYRIGILKMDCADTGWPSDVSKGVALHEGDVFSPTTTENARKTLNQNFRKAGFNGVIVSLASMVHADRATIDIALRVVPGRQQILREIRIAGIETASAGIVANALHLDLDKPADYDEWNRAQSRLYETGAFSRVDIAHESLTPESSREIGKDRESAEPVRAVVTLEEAPLYTLRYGAQVVDAFDTLNETGGSGTGVGIVGDLSRRILFGRAITSGVSFRYNKFYQTSRGYLSSPTFFGLPIRTSAFLGRSHMHLSDETASIVGNRNDFTVEERFRIRKSAQLAFSYSFQRYNVTLNDQDPDEAIHALLDLNIGRITGTLVLDHRNDLIDTTQGWFHSTDFEISGKALGSSGHLLGEDLPLSFTKYLFQQFYYKPVPGRIVLASAARLEISKGAWLNLLLTDRLRAGGANTVRGYSENSLDIRDFVGFSGGRTALLILNQEIRFPIFGIFRGGVFFDHGSLFTWLNGKSEHAARSSTGFGLRITTPFLLLRIDYGIPLNRQPGDPFGRWYFAIGQAF